MGETKAYDLGRFQRLVGVDGKRVSGTFMVLSAKNSRQMWVTTVDVVVWDEGHNSGRVLHSQDLTASVQDGEADLHERSIASNKVDDVLDVWDEMKAALVAAAEAAKFDASGSEIPNSSADTR